jgi:NADH-quinone oxidoreductase subunit L
MLEIIWLIPALPFIGFLALILTGSRLSRNVIAVTGIGAPLLSAIVASSTGLEFVLKPLSDHAYTQILWKWFDLEGLSASVGFYLDPLSLVMVLVVTWVSVLILLYSTRSMAGDDGYSRFFAYMNLFVGSMLVLVLADNLLLLYLGWEGVGLCSYLLIGFWYKKEENLRAAFKAFLVTRIGDAALAVGLFLVYYNLGTLDIQEAMREASGRWVAGSLIANAAAALILGGALGKSAQLPLQTWLPDAMAGPTPVSALIHAATMVTAGVYLIARTNVFFTMAPAVHQVVAVIGACTLFLAASSALVQRDIKKVLAYSTMSQIGYMFLALGVGAWAAAVFHLMVHAFFKSLLFLCAGVVIDALADEHDIFRMGGLRTRLPFVFWTFLIGLASLSAVPFVTGGYYSKDLILSQVWASSRGGALLFLIALAGSALTSLYSFRLFFLVFTGESKTVEKTKTGYLIGIPLAILATLALVGGFVETPHWLGNVRVFSTFVAGSLPIFIAPTTSFTELAVFILSAGVSLGGVCLAYFLFSGRSSYREGPERPPSFQALHRFLFAGWGFDRLYDACFVRPIAYITERNRGDILDAVYKGVEGACSMVYGLLSTTQSGKVRWYAAAMAIGAIIFVGMVILL